MERYNCTCHCGGSMFYKHLHDPSCDLFMHGEEAPQSKEAQLQAALDAEREKVKSLGDALAEEVAYRLNEREELVRQLATLRAQLAALTTAHQSWTEVLGEWLWNCTNLLGDYHIKTVQDFNEEVNRRIAWLMQHLDHTLPPPMTDEERDRMRKLSEDNAALQADNECKDSLIETLQAQLRQVEGERNTARHRVDELEAREIDVEILQGDLTTLRQLVEALPVVDVQEVSVWLSPDESGWLVSKRPAFPAGLYWAKFRTQAEADSFRALLAYRATLAAQDAGKEDVSHD